MVKKEKNAKDRVIQKLEKLVKQLQDKQHELNKLVELAEELTNDACEAEEDLGTAIRALEDAKDVLRRTV
jgi:ABC-type transporter Mla subunit MlaD